MKLFSDTHEWIDVVGTEGTVGVSAYAQKELGEVVYISLPEVGKVVQAGQEVVILESTKAAADIYSPVSGVITAVNGKVKEFPDLLNKYPESDGWIFKISISHPQELSTLMSRDAYEQLVQPK
ncbi:MAG: glycine cleavage system protein GcvH [Rhabdochlamydiaceae bacterium]|jgi:glycine cleavage system H protein